MIFYLFSNITIQSALFVLCPMKVEKDSLIFVKTVIYIKILRKNDVEGSFLSFFKICL